jgi:hypothetical protein
MMRRFDQGADLKGRERALLTHLFLPPYWQCERLVMAELSNLP